MKKLRLQNKSGAGCIQTLVNKDERYIVSQFTKHNHGIKRTHILAESKQASVLQVLTTGIIMLESWLDIRCGLPLFLGKRPGLINDQLFDPA